MDKDSTVILLNDTFSTENCLKSCQLHVQQNGTNSFYQTTHNSDLSTGYKAWQIIQGHHHRDIILPYILVRVVSIFHYLISLTRRYRWIIRHYNLEPAFQDPKINDDDIYITLPEGRPERLNAQQIIIRLRKDFDGLKQVQQLWHDDINAFVLSHGLTQFSDAHKLCLRSNGILVPQYAMDRSV